MNIDVIAQGFKTMNKYWEDQWLIGELHADLDAAYAASVEAADSKKLQSK